MNRLWVKAQARYLVCHPDSFAAVRQVALLSYDESKGEVRLIVSQFDEWDSGWLEEIASYFAGLVGKSLDVYIVRKEALAVG